MIAKPKIRKKVTISTVKKYMHYYYPHIPIVWNSYEQYGITNSELDEIIDTIKMTFISPITNKFVCEYLVAWQSTEREYTPIRKHRKFIYFLHQLKIQAYKWESIKGAKCVSDELDTSNDEYFDLYESPYPLELDQHELAEDIDDYNSYFDEDLSAEMSYYMWIQSCEDDILHSICTEKEKFKMFSKLLLYNEL